MRFVPIRAMGRAGHEMLTYRTGAAGAPSAARAMSEHLLQQTLPPEMAAMAEYYAQGVAPPTAAEAAASRYGARLEAGAAWSGERLEALVTEEIARLRDSTDPAAGEEKQSAENSSADFAMRALGALVAADLVPRDEALACLRRLGHDVDPEHLDAAVTAARQTNDYSSAVATPRRDLNPALAARLGIVSSRSLTPGEIACLLNGQRADGRDIEGKTKQAATVPLRAIFGLARDRLPTREELAHVLAGRTANGAPLPPEQAERAVRRFTTAHGADQKALSPEQREHLLAGRSADGRVLSVRRYQNLLARAKSRIGYVDLTFSAPKSVSVAWAFAPTAAERAMILQAHHDAIDSTMIEVERQLGRARKGQGGKDGFEPGVIGWVSFDHYAARPTVEVVRTSPEGETYTELYTLKAGGARIAGDMQLHTHTAVFNAVLTDSGRVGGLDLAQLEGRVKEWGALYQAYLATNLRRHGVEVVLDGRTELARLAAVPEHVTLQFSKRTLGGTEGARAYAASQGLDWDSLDATRKIGLIKNGVQDPRGAKGDDVSDLAAWQRTAAEIGYHHRSILRPDAIVPLAARSARLETAYQAALPVLAKLFARRAVIDGADVRVAAAKGLIASSIDSADDITALTRAFRQRGVQHQGEATSLIWGQVRGEGAREKVAVTTALHAHEETILIARVRAAAVDRSGALTPAQIAAAVEAFPALDFTSEHGRAQRAIIESLGQGGRFGLAIGVAGSGKSTLLKPLVKAWVDDGRTVYGIALAWRQSDALVESGLTQANTFAVEAFLAGIARGRLTLGREAVVIVDELGLIGTRQLNAILAAQSRLGFQLVAIGDPKQMQAVEAGPVIDLITRALGENAIPELGSSVRQMARDERETVLMFRNGQTEEAIARKHANGTLRIVPGGYQEAVAEIVALWEARRAVQRDRAGSSITISAPTNQDAHAISAAIRLRRKALGEIGEDRIVVRAADGGGIQAQSFDLPLACGDRVRLFRRTNAVFGETGTVGNIGRNGSVLEVRGITDDGLVLKAATGKEGSVPWKNLRDPDTGLVLLAYGEALTTHTAQGSTVTEHIHAMPAGSHLVSAFGAYTSGSRHREQSFIVTSEAAERAEVAGRRPLGDRREIAREDVIANIVRNLSRQPLKEASLGLIERARDLRRGAVRGFQESVQPLEARAAAGQSGSVLVERLARRRFDTALMRQLPLWSEQLVRRAELLGTAVRAGSALAAQLAAVVARRKSPARTYWQNITQQGDAAASETVQAETQRLRRKL